MKSIYLWTSILLIILTGERSAGQWAPAGFAGTYVNQITSISSSIVVSVGGQRLYISTSEGGPWDSVGVPSGFEDDYVFALKSLSDGTILACVDHQGLSAIWRSADRGKNWTRYTIDFPVGFIDTFYEFGRFVYAGAMNGVIYRSSDEGVSWKKVFSAFERQFYSMAAIDSSLFVILHHQWAEHNIFRSTDLGVSWTETNYVGKGEILASVGNRLFLESPYRGISFSDDYGAVWYRLNEGLSDTTKIDILYSDGRNLFTTILGKVYLLQKESGTWIDISDGLPSGSDIILALGIYKGYLFAGTTGYSGFGLWRRPLDQILDLKGYPDGIPGQFDIKSLAPNPFFSQTSLTFALPHGERVLLTLHDLFGRQIRVVADEMRESGEQAIAIDAPDLHPGVYFYRLSAGGIWRIGKMVVVK